MSSGIWLSAGSRHTPFLDEIEARCEVVDGSIIARAVWYGVPAGQYHDVRIRATSWRRESTIDLEPAIDGSTISLEMTLTFPDEG